MPLPGSADQSNTDGDKRIEVDAADVLQEPNGNDKLGDEIPEPVLEENVKPPLEAKTTLEDNDKKASLDNGKSRILNLKDKDIDQVIKPDFGYGKLFSHNDLAAVIPKTDEVCSTLARITTGRMIESMKDWAHDPNTPIQDNAMDVAFAWKDMMRTEMAKYAGSLRAWGPNASDFADLIELLETATHEYRYRYQTGVQYTDGILREIKRYLSIFFDYKDIDTRIFFYRRVLRHGIDEREKIWYRTFQSSGLAFEVPESISHMVIAYAPATWKATWICETNGPSGEMDHKLFSKFDIAIDGRIMSARPRSEQKHKFSTPSPRVLPPRTPPKSVEFKAGYKFDSSFFDTGGRFTIPRTTFDVVDSKVERPQVRYNDESLLMIDGGFVNTMGKYMQEAVDMIILVVAKMPQSGVVLKVHHGEQVAEGLIRKIKSLLIDSQGVEILNDQVTTLSEIDIFNCVWGIICEAYHTKMQDHELKEYKAAMLSRLKAQLCRVYSDLHQQQLVCIEPDSGVRIIENPEDLENSRGQLSSIFEGAFRTPVASENVSGTEAENGLEDETSFIPEFFRKQKLAMVAEQTEDFLASLGLQDNKVSQSNSAKEP
ncbi:hypothetical protein TWF481_011697 [Arthrobotrys musiformis]|uniref:Uncharacterized protein n=1 Tax=Arthrobotrys musiformis TaxID=47236 RepID=A0AAV9W0F6_9PEZI